MKDRIHSDLSNCMSLGKFEKAQKLLKDYPDSLDIIYKDGVFFDLAITKNNLEMLKTLLKYAEDNLVDRPQLKDILNNIINEDDLSPGMKQILTPYIDFEGSQHNTLNDSFLDDYKVAFDEMLEKNNSNENFLTEDNLKKLNEVMENKVKTSENLISFHSAPELIHRQLDHYEDPSNKDVHVSLSGNHLIDTN